MKRARLVGELEVSERHVPPWPGHAELVDGTATYVRHTPPTTAGAEPALYVHGLGGSSQNWTDLAGLLAHRFDADAIDLPGFAARVARWIEHRGRGPVHLVGNSLGGSISVVVAATRPELVRTLTLVSPALPFTDPRRSAQGRLLPLLLVPFADRLAVRRIGSMDPAELTSLVLHACFADPTRLTPQRLAEAIEEADRRIKMPWYADAYLRTLRGLVGSFLRSYLPGSGSMWRLAGRVSAPTLVIGGRQDQLVDVRVAPQTARLIPDSRLLMLDGVGHVAQMEVPSLVARALLALLDETAALAAAGPALAGGVPAGRAPADLASATSAPAMGDRVVGDRAVGSPPPRQVGFGAVADLASESAT